jgi:energy-coupling factor transporter ATP-binding protein EcfA2
MSNTMATPHNNPFPGLRPFHEDEAHLFFGRESQVDAMVDKLAATRFLAVVGTSGSGKSSLVNCGLRPALFGGLLARAGSAWRVAQFRPGSDPLREMARTLAQDGLLFNDLESGAGLSLTDIVDTTLHMSKLGLVDIVEQARLAQGTNLLLVVDQFEELFRYRQLGTNGDDKDKHANISEQATAFVNLLLEAATQTAVPIYVVLTMRSDFLGDCAQFPGLAEAINTGQYLVPRMSRDERRAAIKGPVTVAGGEISPLLLTRLINDVGDNPDQLSILQHALNRTWAYWQHQGSGDGPLALAHYEAIGSMTHALDQHAQKVYAELGCERQQTICEKIFKALTDKATDPRGIRRPTPMSTLCALADATPAEVTEVIDVFRQPSRSFLMPPAGFALLEDTMIDISHESLMRVWQRLNTWADEEAQAAQGYRRLAETAVLHAIGKAGLWRDPELQLVLDWRDQSQPNEAWAARYHPSFTKAIGFLEMSCDARNTEQEERDQRQRLRLEAEQEKVEEGHRQA